MAFSHAVPRERALPRASAVRRFTSCTCAFYLFVRSGSRRSPEVFVMEPTYAGHLHYPPWLDGCTLRGSGASLVKDK